MKFYGCPGEEGAASKAFMAKEGVFNELDAALTWHPGTANEVTSGTCNSCIQNACKRIIFFWIWNSYHRCLIKFQGIQR